MTSFSGIVDFNPKNMGQLVKNCVKNMGADWLKFQTQNYSAHTPIFYMVSSLCGLGISKNWIACFWPSARKNLCET